MLLNRIVARRTANHLSRTQEFLKPIVYGGNDGIVTTFAIVAGFAGANADGTAGIGTIAVLVFGLANLFADAVSMGLGEFLSGRSQRDLYLAQRNRELEELTADRVRERAELEALLLSRGFAEDAARDAAAILVRNPDFVADLRMSYEYEMTDPQSDRPAANGLVTFLSFVVFGIIPLAPYLLGVEPEPALPLSVAATALALLLLGTLRWRATGEGALRALAETIFVGGICAAVAYAVGAVVAGV